MLVDTELNDANLISAINAKVIPVASYPMNICKFSNGELDQLDQVIKKELHAKNMLGQQASNERLYLKWEVGGRGLKSMKDVYKETRLRIACYMLKSPNRWIKAAWRREQLKEENSIVAECLTIMEEIVMRMRFEGDNLKLDEQLIELEWKPTWRKVKTEPIKGLECRRIEMYKVKQQQSKLFSDQEEECHMWLSQNLHPSKTSTIINMLEQMVETRSWKAVRGLVEDGRCRVCNEQSGTVEHLVAGCKVLANSEYLSRHNRALMILAVEWAKEYDLIGMNTVWYKERW